MKISSLFSQIDQEFISYTRASKFLLEQYIELFSTFKEYEPLTPCAKLCQLIHNQEGTNQIKEAFTIIPDSIQNAIRIKIEEIFLTLPENKFIENKELLKTTALLASFDSRRDILIRAILETLNENFQLYTPDEKMSLYCNAAMSVSKGKAATAKVSFPFYENKHIIGLIDMLSLG